MKRALLVGINDYSWAQLAGCANDAIELGTALSRNHDGSANFVCKVMIADQKNKHQAAQKRFTDRFENKKRITQSTLKKSVSDLFKGECDIALFFFAGHGYEDNLGGKLVTSDAVKWDEGFSVSDILLLANQATHIREVFLILDCCYSGHIGNVPAINVNQALLRPGISILTASQAGEVSKEKDGQGMFTSILVEGLKGGAADVTGKVTAASLYNYADNAFGAFEQRPVYKSHVSWLRPLRTAEPRVPHKEIRMIPEFFKAKNSKYKLNKSFEPTAKPHNEENEKQFGILQRYRAAGLVEPTKEEHLYWEAMKNGSCKLTMLGKLYWQMVKNNRI